MNKRAFKKIIEEILEDLPKDFSEKIENVSFIVEKEPSRKDLQLEKDTLLLGLYEGIPLPNRSPADYGGVLPDRIIIFQKPIETIAGKDPKQIRKVLQQTLLHEIAHYFGISDLRLREIGAY